MAGLLSGFGSDKKPLLGWTNHHTTPLLRQAMYMCASSLACANWASTPAAAPAPDCTCNLVEWLLKHGQIVHQASSEGCLCTPAYVLAIAAEEHDQQT